MSEYSSWQFLLAVLPPCVTEWLSLEGASGGHLVQPDGNHPVMSVKQGQVKRYRNYGRINSLQLVIFHPLLPST